MTVEQFSPPPEPSLFNRRDVLRVGSISFAGSLLGSVASQTEAAHKRNVRANGKAKQVLFLWMGGGVTHLDSFDPKPLAPETIRGTLSPLATALPGVQFNEPMPNLARIANDICLVRSFSHDSNDHLLSQVYTLSGRKVNRSELFKHPNIGSIFSYLFGPRNGLPGYIAVPGITRPGPPPHNLFVGGWLGSQYAPFAVGGQPDQPDFTKGPNPLHPNPFMEEELKPKALELSDGLTTTRLQRRSSLRQILEDAARAAESQAPTEGIDGHYEAAMNMLTSPRVRGAFDLSQESAKVRDEYGRTKIGSRCLQARRLIEAGARFVMVDYGYDPDYGNLWDQHNASSQKFPHTSKMCMRPYHLAGIDKSFAALISDLKMRGLLDSTLVVFLTEFGRTPKINKNGGRDHWGACGSIFFTGGGVKTGQVIGASDKQGGYPITKGYGPADIAATIYRAVGLEPDHHYLRDIQDRPWQLLDHGRAIDGVLG
ncbi:MAG: DUF1501 domain-containing protein [Planctomycetaceae bacterium]